MNVVQKEDAKKREEMESVKKEETPGIKREEKGRARGGKGGQKKKIRRQKSEHRPLAPNQDAQGGNITEITPYWAVSTCLLPISPDPLKILQSGLLLFFLAFLWGYGVPFGRIWSNWLKLSVLSIPVNYVQKYPKDPKDPSIK